MWIGGITGKNRLQVTFLGGVREEPEEFQEAFDQFASAGLSADGAGTQAFKVWWRLQVRAKTDGTLEVEKVIEGEPAPGRRGSSRVYANGG